MPTSSYCKEGWMPYSYASGPIWISSSSWLISLSWLPWLRRDTLFPTALSLMVHIFCTPKLREWWLTFTLWSSYAREYWKEASRGCPRLYCMDWSAFRMLSLFWMEKSTASPKRPSFCSDLSYRAAPACVAKFTPRSRLPWTDLSTRGK